MIPVIDFQSESVLEEIREAYTTVGFAVFTNALNSAEQITMTKWFSLMKEFFELDAEVKNKYKYDLCVNNYLKYDNISISEYFNILSIKNQPYRLLLGSAHQMGTARINPNPEQGVVDLDGKVHGLENVYIVDASTFPICSGVNPMISIQSMSHFLMSKI